jgi:FtsZ-binding cell division protein ZapB
MGASSPDSAEIESLKNELMSIREKSDELERENEILKDKLQKYENKQ